MFLLPIPKQAMHWSAAACPTMLCSRKCTCRLLELVWLEFLNLSVAGRELLAIRFRVTDQLRPLGSLYWNPSAIPDMYNVG